MLRCTGRLCNSDSHVDAKFPLLLRSKSPLTELIIQYVHTKWLHSGVSYVLGIIRDKYWIPRGRQRVKCVLRKCVTCKRYQGRTLAPPSTALYPYCRVSQANPFAATGVDYTGALTIRQAGNLVKV